MTSVILAMGIITNALNKYVIGETFTKVERLTQLNEINQSIIRSFNLIRK